MKRIIAFALAIVMLCALAAPALAAEITNGNDVVARYIATYEGEYRAAVENGSATAGGITVSGAPENARVLVIVPMEGEALRWIDSCIKGTAQAAYDIHFLDADGNRISANGVTVSVGVSGPELTVSSVAVSGKDRTLPVIASSGKLSFTADGSHYYVIARKNAEPEPNTGDTVTVPVRGEENTVHADVTYVEKDAVRLETLDEEEIDHIVGDHVNTGVVEIDLTDLHEDVTKVVLPVDTVRQIVDAAEEAHNDTEALQIDFPSGSVKLDDRSMRVIVEQAVFGEIALVMNSVGEAELSKDQQQTVADWHVYGSYEVYATSGDQRLEDFGGGVATMSVPLAVPEGLSKDNFTVYRIDGNGSAKKLESWYADGQLHWNAEALADFVVAYEGDVHENCHCSSCDPVQEIPAADRGGNCFLWILLLILLLITVILLFLLLHKRKKREEEA